MSDAVTLAGIVGSQVSIQWFEAVALVREVADRLASVSTERAIPELKQIRLSPEGHVDIIGVTPTDEPVRRMGQLLQALVAHSDSPVQLRLVITQATSPSPQYETIRDYSEALGFFERPERSTVLQTLAARVVDAAVGDAADRGLTLDSLAPLPTPDRPKREESTSQQPIQSRSRKWGFAVVAVVVLLAAGAGAWYAHSRGFGPQNRDEASALTNRASDAVGTAFVKGASAITETLGLGRIVPAKEAEPPVAEPPPPAAAAKPPQSRRRDVAPAEANPIQNIIAFDLDRPVKEGSGPSVPAEPVGTTDSTRTEVQSADDETIYSTDSTSVFPPIGVRPKLARQLPPDFDPSRLGRIELIIGVDGSVESAKLLGPPRTVNDGLFLSVAKAWQFQPALKGGVPVRYRKTIWVASP